MKDRRRPQRKKRPGPNVRWVTNPVNGFKYQVSLKGKK